MDLGSDEGEFGESTRVVVVVYASRSKVIRHDGIKLIKP